MKIRTVTDPDLRQRWAPRAFVFPAVLLVAALVAGCMTVGPDHVSPATEDAAPAQWVSADLDTMQTNVPVLAVWWTQFDDPVLDQLVETALTNNLDLAQARSRVREARARRGIETASRFPVLNMSGSAQAVKEGSQPSGELYATGFDASWEIDLFGSVSRRIEAAAAELGSQVEAQRAVRVSLLAELALNYVEYRVYEKRAKIAHGNVDVLQETLNVVQTRYESGLADRLQVSQAESNLATEQSRAPLLQAGRDRAAYRLAVLIGERPGAVSERLSELHAVPAPLPESALGIPADLLRRRPDLRRAERELAAQSARVGIATADLYPRFSLNGNLRFGTADAADLFAGDNRFFGIGPAFSWNVFNAGRVRNNIRIQNEKQQQALLNYEQTVLLALEETENAMTAYLREQERRTALSEAVRTARQTAALAESLYLDGLRDFIHVLDAQRVLFAAEDQLVVSDGEVTAHLIRLYKSLGGGWSPPVSEDAED